MDIPMSATAAAVVPDPGPTSATTTARFTNCASLSYMVEEYYQKLLSRWQRFGHSEEIIQKRTKQVYKHAQDLFSDMDKEEQIKYEELEKQILEIEQQITNLCIDLEEHIPPVASTTLLQKLTEVEKHRVVLKAKKEQKMKDWINLKEKEGKVAESLGEKAPVDPFLNQGIPTKADVAKLKETVTHLEHELKSRITKYKELKSNIVKYLDELERLPQTEVERGVLGHEGTPPVLSTTLIDQISENERALASEDEANIAEAESLRNGIDELRRRLKEEDHSLDLPIRHGPTALAVLRAEHSRLQALKLVNIGKFISELATEIDSLSQLVFKDVELPSQDENADNLEELLTEYERVYQELQDYQAAQAKVITMWNQREAKWIKWIELDQKANDPNRFKNRGGALLQEEKERKLLEKVLPKMEKDLIALATSTGFTYHGQDAKDYIDGQWDAFNTEKEERKNLKKAGGAGATLGNVTVMNQTRKRGAQGTPLIGSTPGKRGKLAPSNFGMVRTPRKIGGGGTAPPSPTYSEFTNSNINTPTPLRRGANSNAKVPILRPRPGPKFY